MSRRVAAPVVPYRPQVFTEQRESRATSSEKWTNWSFFESNSYEVTWELVARAAMDTRRRTLFVYLGRKTKPGVSVIRGSSYEFNRMNQFLKQALDQIEIHPVEGRSFDSLIPMLDNYPGARSVNKKENRFTYFDDAQFKTESFKAKLVFNEQVGGYELLIHSPVSKEIQNELKWPGPVFSFNVEEMKVLESTLDHIIPQVQVRANAQQV